MKGGLFAPFFTLERFFIVRGYSYRNITPLVPKHATYLPDESLSVLAYRHPERTKTLYV